MNSQKAYRTLVLLLPIVYLVHNFEEWFVLKSVYLAIIPSLPNSIGEIVSADPDRFLSVFGYAIVFATILPIAILPFMLGKATPLRAQTLLIIGFATLINAISHITSSFSLGFFSPGVITGVILCFPYSFAVIVFTKKYFKFQFSKYMLMLAIAFLVYFVAIALSWIFGYFMI